MASFKLKPDFDETRAIGRRRGRLARGATSAGPSTSGGGPSISVGGGSYSGASAAGVAALNAGGYNASQGNTGGVTAFSSGTGPGSAAAQPTTQAVSLSQINKPAPTANFNLKGYGNYQATRNTNAITSTNPAVDRANIAQSQYVKSLRSGGVPLATALSKPQTTQSYFFKGVQVPREQMPSYQLTKQFFAERGYDFVNKPGEIPNSAFKAEKQAAARSQTRMPVMGDLMQKVNTYPKASSNETAKMQTIVKQFTVPYSPVLQAEKGNFMGSTNPAAGQTKTGGGFFANAKTGVMSKSPVGFLPGLESKAKDQGILLPGLQSKIKYNLPPKKPDPVGEFFGGFVKEAENTGRFLYTFPQGIYSEVSTGFKRDAQGNYASQKIIDANIKELKTPAEKAGGFAFFAATAAVPIPGLKAARGAGSAIKGAAAKAVTKAVDPAEFFLPKSNPMTTKTSGPGSFFTPKNSNLPFKTTEISLGKGSGKSTSKGGKSAATSGKSPPGGGSNNFFADTRKPPTNTGKGGQMLIQKPKQEFFPQLEKPQTRPVRPNKPAMDFFEEIRPATRQKQFMEEITPAKVKTKNELEIFSVTPKTTTRLSDILTPKQKGKTGTAFDVPYRSRTGEKFTPRMGFFTDTSQKRTPALKTPPEEQPRFTPGEGAFSWPGEFFGSGVASGGSYGLPYGRKINTAWNVNPNKVLGFLPGPEYQTGGEDVFVNLDYRTANTAKTTKAMGFFGSNTKQKKKGYPGTSSKKSNPTIGKRSSDFFGVSTKRKSSKSKKGGLSFFG